MAKPGIDITCLGDRELSRMLAKLPMAAQKKVIRPALRKAAKRVHEYVIRNISGVPVAVRTGRYLTAWAHSKVRTASYTRNLIRLGLNWPLREELGIHPSDKFFYPTAIEYGHKRAPPHPHLRPAVDVHKQSEHRRIARDIGAGIVKQAKKL